MVVIEKSAVLRGFLGTARPLQNTECIVHVLDPLSI